MITQGPQVDEQFALPRSDSIRQATGWMLVAAGAGWMLAGLWAMLFTAAVDHGGTEAVTALFNLAIPLVLTLPAVSVLRAGLRRVGPVRPQLLWRRVRGSPQPPAQL